MSISYVYEKAKKVVNALIARKLSLCYVRVRCPCCGMWTRLDNLKLDQPLFEESTTYSGGRAKLIHVKTVNESLRPFWINRLKLVLGRLGFEVVEKPYFLEVLKSYQYGDRPNYDVEKGVNYVYER